MGVFQLARPLCSGPWTILSWIGRLGGCHPKSSRHGCGRVDPRLPALPRSAAPVAANGRPAHHRATCLLYTSDAADEEDSVDLGGRRIIKKKKKKTQTTK